MEALLINLAPNGMVPTRADAPRVPISAAEIADDILGCAEIGITTAHIHARNADESPSSDPAVFAPILEAVRADPRGRDLVLCVTTSGRKVTDPEQRAAVLDLDGAARPDMASLTLGSMNFMRQGAMNSPETIRFLAQRMQERGIRPELEVFDLGMVNFARVLIKEGLITPPYYFNILLGNVATAQASLAHLSVIVNDLPPGSVWGLAGLGRFQRTMNGLGVLMADGVRTGLEDNTWLDDEHTRPASNADLVRRIHDLAAALDRPIATAAAARTRLGLFQHLSDP